MLSFLSQHGLFRAKLKVVPVQNANKHTGKSISQNQVEKSQSKSRYIVGTHIVLFFSQHGLYRAKLKAHQYKRPSNNTGTIHNYLSIQHSYQKNESNNNTDINHSDLPHWNSDHQGKIMGSWSAINISFKQQMVNSRTKTNNFTNQST